MAYDLRKTLMAGLMLFLLVSPLAIIRASDRQHSRNGRRFKPGNR